MNNREFKNLINLDKNNRENLAKKKRIKRKRRTTKHSSHRVYGPKWASTAWWIVEDSPVTKCWKFSMKEYSIWLNPLLLKSPIPIWMLLIHLMELIYDIAFT